MNLEDFASKLCSKNDFIKASFGGFAGSGKTRTASEFVAGVYKQLGFSKPLLIIDNEFGSRFLSPFFTQKNIPVMVKNTVYIADVIKSFEFIKKGEIDFIFIDSLTKVWYQYIRDFKSSNNLKFLSLNDWGKIIPAWQEQFNDVLVSTEGCIVFTGRGGYEYDLEEEEKPDGSIKKQFVKSGVKMKLTGETPFEPDLNIWMQLEQSLDGGRLLQWREAHILKDRSNLIDGKVFKDPTYNDFKPVIDFLTQLEKGDIIGASDTSNITPFENYPESRKKKIIIDEIEGKLTMKWPGTSRDEKVCKSAIKKEYLGTYSDDKIKSLPLDILETAKSRIYDVCDCGDEKIIIDIVEKIKAGR